MGPLSPPPSSTTSPEPLGGGNKARIAFPNAKRSGIDWSALRNRPLDLVEKQRVREFYAATYVQGEVYGQRHRLHVELGRYRARMMQAVFPDHGKVLDLGCSTGGDVVEFRGMGIDTWGFDLCPDLPDIALPEARPFLRMGRVDHIPFGAADGFRTGVCYDVLEHVPVNDLDGFPAELDRLGIRNLAMVIAADTISPGHITIQSTEWWGGAAGPRRLPDLG